MERLTASLDWFTHGWHAINGAWHVVIVGMWADLWLPRAPSHDAKLAAIKFDVKLPNCSVVAQPNCCRHCSSLSRLS